MRRESSSSFLFALLRIFIVHMMLTARAAGRADGDRFITHLSDVIGGVFAGPRVGGIAQSLSRRSTGARGGRQGSKRTETRAKRPSRYQSEHSTVVYLAERLPPLDAAAAKERAGGSLLPPSIPFTVARNTRITAVPWEHGVFKMWVTLSLPLPIAMYLLGWSYPRGSWTAQPLATPAAIHWA